MSEAEVMQIVKDSLNELLRWVGFGTLAGLAAKAIMPGRDPGGAVGTPSCGLAHGAFSGATNSSGSAEGEPVDSRRGAKKGSRQLLAGTCWHRRGD